MKEGSSGTSPTFCHHARPPQPFHNSEPAAPGGLPAPPRHRLTGPPRPASVFSRPDPEPSGRGVAPQEVIAFQRGRYFRLRYHGRLLPRRRACRGWREEAAVREPVAERSDAGLPPQCLVTALPLRPTARPLPLLPGALREAPPRQLRVSLPCSRRPVPKGKALRGQLLTLPAAGTGGP